MAQSWKCLNDDCGKEFKAIEGFDCFPGQKHVVEAKTYYIADAPVGDDSGVSYRNSRTDVHNIPPETKVIDAVSGQTKTQPGGYVTFVRGMFTTSDPEQQFYIEKLMGKSLISKDHWEQIYFSKREKEAMSASRTAAKEAEADRKLREANELLAMARKKSGKE